MVITTIAAMLMGATLLPEYMECDGKCCYYQAGCDLYPTVAQRLKCCEYSCSGATYLGCVDEAIGGSAEKEEQALVMLNDSCSIIENWNPVYQATGQYADAIQYFKLCAQSQISLVRRVAIARAAESDLLTALVPHNEQGSPHNEQGDI